MIFATQLMRRTMGCLSAIPKRNSTSSFYITLPEMPDSHIPNIGLMPVLNKLPKFLNINPVGSYFDMGKACIQYEEEISSIINKVEECGNDISFAELLEEMDKCKVHLYTLQGLQNILNLVQQPGFSENLHKKLNSRFLLALQFPLKSESLLYYFKEVNKSQLNPVEQRILSNYLLSYEIEGMQITPRKKDKFTKSSARVELFSKQYLVFFDIQNTTYSQEITKKKTMEEFPSVIKSLMCDYDTDPNEGPWVFTMNPILIENFFKYCSNHGLRSICWNAMISRCTSFTNPRYKNSSVIEDIRGFRRLMATTCGKKNYSDLIMLHTMAGSAENVVDVLKAVSENVRPAYVDEIESLIELANSKGQLKEFEPCDIPYWGRHQLQEIIGTPELEILQYFPFEHVWSEALSWCSQLLEVTFKLVEVKDKSMLWHESVRIYEICDSDGSSMGFFYLDPFMRASKKFNLYGKFTFVPIRPGNKIGSVPLNAIIGGMSHFGSNNEYFLSLTNVQELLGMLGCLMQETITTNTYSDASGTSGIENDVAFTTPYLFCNWARNPEFLKRLSKHCITNEPISDSLAKRLSSSFNHLAAHNLSNSMMISHIDMLMYSTNKFWLDIVEDAWKHYQPLPYNPLNHFVCSTPSIVVGPLQSCYYRSFWSEMLAADLYTAFKNCPEADISALAKNYRDTLMRREGKSAAESFKEFMGRDPDINAITILNNIQPVE